MIGIGVFEVILLAFVALLGFGIVAIVRSAGRSSERDALDELDRPVTRERIGRG